MSIEEPDQPDQGFPEPTRTTSGISPFLLFIAGGLVVLLILLALSY